MALVRTNNDTDDRGRKRVTLIHRQPQKLSSEQKADMVDVGEVVKPSIEKQASVKPWLDEDDNLVWKAVLKPDADGFEEKVRSEDGLGRSKARELASSYPDLLRALDRMGSEDRERVHRGMALLGEVVEDMKDDGAITEDEESTLVSLMEEFGISPDGEPKVLVYDDGEWVEDE